MIFFLQAQYYTLQPTRQASRWAQSHTSILFEADDLAAVALFRVGTLPDPANRDIFLRSRDGHITPEILDEFWRYRRLYSAAG